MTRTIDKIRELVSLQISAIAPETIKPESTLIDDLGLDELDRLELAMEIESIFGLDITDHNIEEFRTIADIVKFIDSVRAPATNGIHTHK